MARYEAREGEDMTDPGGAIFGPKTMIINQSAGSGGDLMPWYFRKAGLGPLIGVRTWGGLVGIGGYPVLLDGGQITAPHTAIYGLHGQFEVENHGIPPDIEVEYDPKSVAAGHDPQLERAVQYVMEQLKEHPLPTYPSRRTRITTNTTASAFTESQWIVKRRPEIKLRPFSCAHRTVSLCGTKRERPWRIVDSAN